MIILKKMETKNKVFLFNLNDQDKRPVYLMKDTGILSIKSDFGRSEYKRKYEVFVDSYKRSRNLFTIFRDKFHQAQAELYVKSRSISQKIFNRSLTYVPQIHSYGNFLDIGCNTGSFLSKIPDIWIKYGVEINNNACKESLKYENIKVFNSGLEDLKSEIKFDFLRLSHVVEHIIEYDLFFQKMYEIMNHNSYALIYTPNTKSLSYFLFKRYWACFYEKTHVNMFNLKNLEELSKKHGFEIVERGTYYMGTTAASIVLLLHLNPNSRFGKLIYMSIFCFLFPFSFVINILNLGGALYLYIKK